MQERMTEKEFNRRLDAIKLCGINRGPHDYIPMSWLVTKEAKHVAEFICKVCFVRVRTETLIKYFPEVFV